MAEKLLNHCAFCNLSYAYKQFYRFNQEGMYMISTKIGLLSLLCISPQALAYVQCDTDLELRVSPQPERRLAITTKHELHKSAVIYASDDMRIEATLVSEQDDSMMLHYAVYASNTEGIFELVTEPKINAYYGQQAGITIGNDLNDVITLQLNAKKI